jgi:membrane dipeptidase
LVVTVGPIPLDGGFGRQQSPYDLDTIADPQRLPDLLRKRGYDTVAIERILYDNWVRFFREAWQGKVAGSRGD